MCSVDEDGKKVGDCGRCVCSESSEYNKHNKVATGEAVMIGQALIRTYKCTKGCGTYQ
jgi:hypothetical protein